MLVAAMSVSVAITSEQILRTADRWKNGQRHFRGSRRLALQEVDKLDDCRWNPAVAIIGLRELDSSDRPLRIKRSTAPGPHRWDLPGSSW